MANRTAEMERKTPAKPRKAKPKAADGTSPNSRKNKTLQPLVSPITWPQAARAALAIALAGLAAGALATHVAGHAPSWRSLRALTVMAAPLFPTVLLLWMVLGLLRARYARPPRLVWTGLAALGTLAAMFLGSGLAFAVLIEARALMRHGDVADHLWGMAAAFYLFATTAFRLWWPWGAALPALAALLFWRDSRS